MVNKELTLVSPCSTIALLDDSLRWRERESRHLVRDIVMKYALKACVAALALIATPAAADIVSYNGTDYNTGETINISFTGESSGNPVDGLSADLSLLFTGVDANGDYTFDWSLTNTSTMHDLSTVVAFGFNVDPDFIDATVTGDFTTDSSGSISNGYFVEFCATGGPNCAGGANTGDGVGGGSFEGSLVFDFGLTAPDIFTISQPIVRFQSTGANGEGSGVGVPGVVPEPGTWAMMLMGFGAAGYAMRRRRRIGAIAQLA